MGDPGIEKEAEQDEALAGALAALGSPVRLALLRAVRAPKALGEIMLKPATHTEGWGQPGRNLSRQAVKNHLDRLLEIRAVTMREAERQYGSTVEYVLNHQALFALAERLRGLARLRPVPDVLQGTLPEAPVANPYALKGPCLVLVKGLDEGRIFPLEPPSARGGEQEWVLGRRRGLGVTLDYDPFVSKEHARVTWRNGRYVLGDLPGSLNGTTLNFQPLPDGGEQPMDSGDVIGVGRSLLLLRC